MSSPRGAGREAPGARQEPALGLTWLLGHAANKTPLRGFMRAI